ncbi:MAG: O-antigen ligase family protein [Chloroflexi bacterium]|nr:O-antigen ligase family protein [Chloroflexota bacterium]
MQQAAGSGQWAESRKQKAAQSRRAVFAFTPSGSVWYRCPAHHRPGVDDPLTRRDLGFLAAFALALLFATGPRLDLVVEGSVLYVVLALLRPALALAVVAASLPLYALPAEAGLSSGATETALLLSAVGIGGRWLVERARGLKTPLVRPGPTLFDRPAALFLVAALASLLVSEYLHLSLRELRTLVLEPVLFFYLLAAVVRGRREARRVVEAFLVAAVAVAVLGVGQWAFGLNTTQAEGVHRAAGTFGSPNHLGLYLGRAVPFLVAGLLWYRGRRRWAYGLGALGVGAGLGATFSAGAWLGVGAAVLAIAVIYARSFPERRRYVLAVGLVAALALATAAVPLARVERVASHLDPSQGTTFFRLQLWSASLAMARDHALLGVGMDNFLYLYQQSYLPEAAAQEPNLSHPHNLVLHFWLQLGLLGLVSVGWLLVSFFSRTHHLFYSARSASVRALSLGAAASMLDFLVHGLVDNSYFLPDLAYVFWLSLALAQVLANDE